MATRADIEALILRALRGEPASAGPGPVVTAQSDYRDVDLGEAWRGLSPTSQDVYRRTRAIEAAARARGGALTETEHAYLAADHGEDHDERARRLALMMMERPRAETTEAWRESMRAVVARWDAALLDDMRRR